MSLDVLANKKAALSHAWRAAFLLSEN